MKKPTSAILLISVAYLILTIVLVGFGYASYNSFSNQDCTIYYISKEEIMDFENERLNKLPDNQDKQIFFGKLKEALDIITKEAQIRQDRGDIVIFSDTKVSGKGVISLSNEIHLKIIESLK